jgi:hypothetical protein
MQNALGMYTLSPQIRHMLSQRPAGPRCVATSGQKSFPSICQKILKSSTNYLAALICNLAGNCCNDGAEMRTDDIQFDRRQCLFWSDFLTCPVSLWALSCFGHHSGRLMTEVGHFDLT